MLQNVPWTEDELKRALHLYRKGVQRGGDDPGVKNLSRELKARKVDGARYHHGHRSPDAVAMQLARFASNDPASRYTGRDRGSKLLQKVWRESQVN
jgi:hypothetical protein